MEVTIEVISNWGTAGNGQITVKNITQETKTNWSIIPKFENFIPTQFYNFLFTNLGNNNYSLKPAYSPTLSPGGSWSVLI